ncbi:MAG: hypothetical protein M1597_02440 [Candidatus Thermoplasmatota archaeon]|nr:hypothetical protein [Candidatus Thermoplasmatota archaeon]
MSGETEPRTILINAIGSEPGLHFRALQRKTGMAIGQLEYHLYKLEREEEIVIRKDGRYKRYFLSSSPDNAGKMLGYHLRNRINREILLYLLRNGEMSFESLNKKIKDKQKLEDAIKSLITDNILVRERDACYIRNPVSIKEYIKRSKKSFMEELTDSLIDLLDEE